MRNVVVWVSLSLLVYACFAPWAEVTTFSGESFAFGSMSEYTGGGQFVLVCAGAAAVGLLVRATGFAALSALTATGLSVMLGYQTPGNLLQFGHEAHATWGCFLAIGSASILFLAARGEERVAPEAGDRLPGRSREPSRGS